METNRKRRGGFIKAKLVGLPFYKAAKPAPTTVQYNSKVTPSQQASKSTASVGFVVHQDYVVSQSKPKVSYVVPEKKCDPFAFDKVFTYPCDEAVDLKATNYISSVQERFKLEQTEYVKCQDIVNP